MSYLSFPVERACVGLRTRLLLGLMQMYLRHYEAGILRLNQ